MQSAIHRSHKRAIQAMLLSAALSFSLVASAKDVGTKDVPSPTTMPRHDARACPPHGAQMLQRMQQHHKQRLAQLAQQLQLQPGQQDAWRAYVQAEEAIPVPPPCPKPGQTALDAAQARAAHAAQMSAHLDAVSKALATLWPTLSPTQQQTFDRNMHAGMPPRANEPMAPAPGAMQ